MIKRFLSVLLCCLVTVTGLSGCGGDSSAQIIYYDLSVKPTNLDPILAYDISSATIVTNIYEGLLRQTADGSVENGVAERYEVSGDGLKYTFYLREDAKWNEGTSLTAHDFVFAFQRLFRPSSGSSFASEYYCIKNAEAVHTNSAEESVLGVYAQDDHTLVFELEYPEPLFLHLLTQPAAMPCNEAFFLSTSGQYGLKKDSILSNGPYYIKYWSAEDDDYFLTLRLNGQYNSDVAVENAGVTLYYVPEEEKRINSFIEEDADAISVSGATMSQLMEQGYNIDLSVNATWGILFNREHECFSQELAQAMSLCMDRTTYQEELGDYYSLAERIVPPAVTVNGEAYQSLSKENVTLPQYDIDQAKESFRLAKQNLEVQEGFPGMNALTILIPEGAGHAQLLANVSQVWQEKLGFYLRVEQLPMDEYLKAMETWDESKYLCALYELSGNYDSPSAVLEQFADNSSNRCGYRNSEYDELLSVARHSGDVDEMLSFYAQAEEILLRDAVFLPMYHETTCFVTQSKWTGFRFDSFHYVVDFKQVREKT